MNVYFMSASDCISFFTTCIACIDKVGTCTRERENVESKSDCISVRMHTFTPTTDDDEDNDALQKHHHRLIFHCCTRTRKQVEADSIVCSFISAQKAQPKNLGGQLKQTHFS